ncbi:hypothetical protein RB195_018936 [Necator americanus]|uniref:Uncharacterized protein n=1 Tax=Necator americanus TaxID=51031 RepID=A0ABR1CDZ7_NECAM
MAASNLLTLRDFTLITTWPELASKSKEELDEWVADRGLLWKKRLSQLFSCGSPVKVAKQVIANSLHKC